MVGFSSLGFNSYNTTTAGGNGQQRREQAGISHYKNVQNITPPSFQQDFYAPRQLKNQADDDGFLANHPFNAKSTKKPEQSFFQRNWVPITVGTLTVGALAVGGVMTRGKLWGKAKTAISTTGDDIAKAGKKLHEQTIEELTKAKGTATGSDLDEITQELFHKYNSKFSKSVDGKGVYTDKESGQNALREAQERLKLHDDQVIKLEDYDRSVIQFEMGHIQLKLGNYDDALAAFKQANKIDYSHEAERGIAIVYAKQGKIPEGIQVVKKLLTEFRNDSGIRSNPINESLEALSTCLKTGDSSQQKLSEVVDALISGSYGRATDAQKILLKTKIGDKYTDLLHNADNSAKQKIDWVLSQLSN